MLSVAGLTRRFGDQLALDDVTFDVVPGRMTGFVGANGAGKTTTMRIILGVLAASSGEVSWNGGPLTQTIRSDFGYMPEERGLYPRMVLEEQLLYFAQLKGMGRAEALRRLGPWLERLGLADWRKRKLNELSKGMQQKAQFIATVLHDPEILILDEPMSGLDPVGMNVMRDVLLDQRKLGKTLVLSSHQMETVERLCDAIALINRGRKLLDGPVSEVKGRYGANTVALAYEGDGSFLAGLPGVKAVSDSGRYVEIQLVEGADPQVVLREAATRLRVSRFEVIEPSLHDIFVQVVTTHGKGEEAA